jgi:Peptidase A4 family
MHPEREPVEAAEEQNRIRQALGVRPFTPPPEGFDPLQASPRELLVHGYPGRPDARLHPKLHERWEEVASRPITVVEPRFVVMEHKGGWSRERYGLPAGSGWAGSVQFSEKDDPVTFVSGQWTVPHIVAPIPDDCICAQWIGIDGANDAPIRWDSGDILQAGTTQAIAMVGFVSVKRTFAWVEWYPELPATIANFPVSEGDVMQCTICVYSPTEAGVHLFNMTSGAYTAFVKTAPSNVQLVGNCAEWIVEDPTSLGWALARYGDVYFDNCVAGTRAGKLLLAGTGRLDEMYDTNGRTISMPYAENDLLVKVEYTDRSP